MVFSVQTFDGSRGRCLNTRPKAENKKGDSFGRIQKKSCIFHVTVFYFHKWYIENAWINIWFVCIKTLGHHINETFAD